MNQEDRKARAEHDEAEVLARVVTAQMKDNRWRDLTPLAVARAVLASDWLARHDTETAARAWDEGWNAAGDAFVAGATAAQAGLPMPDSGDGPPNPYRAAALRGGAR